ncbi:hypothetical protein, partial [Mycoplasmopsis bovis]|uniref:hypothetical protein n=1 Tax=Mycoplasmopsis bovis TaxID=28903 RepID=UPI003D2DA0D1
NNSTIANDSSTIPNRTMLNVIMTSCVQKLILGPTINSTKINIINKNESPSAKKMFCFINTSAWLKNTSITIALINATNVEYENQKSSQNEFNRFN